MPRILNLTTYELNKIMNIIIKHHGKPLKLEGDEPLKSILYAAYELYGYKFKDSHRAIIELKLNMPNHLEPWEIADTFAIPLKGINPRWNATILPRMDRYILATLHYINKTPQYKLEKEDIIAITDMSARCVDIMNWYNINNFRELVNFNDTYKPDVCLRIKGTTFGEETYRELISAEILIRKNFMQ